MNKKRELGNGIAANWASADLGGVTSVGVWPVTRVATSIPERAFVTLDSGIDTLFAWPLQERCVRETTASKADMTGEAVSFS